ncbi:glucosamine-6-phosphate deaminase [Planctomycetota bacterium]
MATRKKTTILLSPVEQAALAGSPYAAVYPPTEKIATLVVENFPMLGKLTALRFLEWVQGHPGGAIALPTGKTPEYFITWVRWFHKHWETPEAQKELDAWGIDQKSPPDLRGLRFVQIDEFYPMDSAQTNSFTYYVRKFYLRGFGLDAKRALLIDTKRIGLSRGETLEDLWPNKEVDLSLRYRSPQTSLEERQQAILLQVDQWCMDYEQRIQSLGGIGFFLGGIGPDGHIGFNIAGSDHFSTTRLCPVNYPTQAAAATDLGGIETARKSLVITIGLRTITCNPDCVAVIMAAGQAKAALVARAIQSEPDVAVPASALQVLPQARFYLTQGAADRLTERCYVRIKQEKPMTEETQDRIWLDVAVQRHKSLLQLTRRDLESDRRGQWVLKRMKASIKQLNHAVYRRTVGKIERGMQVLEGKRFLHTEPHHDDIMLGYFAQVVRHFRKASNDHFFMTLTSGFTSVTNRFMADQVANLQSHLHDPEFALLQREKYFDPTNAMARNRDVWQYLDGIAAHDETMKSQGCARRLLRNLRDLYGREGLPQVDKRLQKLAHYFETEYPGKQDPPDIQSLKGRCREWEAECLWGYYGWNCDKVSHLRLGFYTGDIFTPQPTWGCDVQPIVQQLKAIRPDVLTVAFDPEGSGPDTHYKVLQVLAEALQAYQEETGHWDIRVWGYRNVWYRFDPAEADIAVPVSLCMFSVMREAFGNAFLSQREASFPSYEYDGPFADLAQRIQVEQYQQLKVCLGRDWFYHHSSPLIRATRGLVFLKEMNAEEFYASCQRLRRSLEAEERKEDKKGRT